MATPAWTSWLLARLSSRADRSSNTAEQHTDARKTAKNPEYLNEKPSCELAELYRWRDEFGVEHVIYLGLDGRRYRHSYLPERSLAWQVCPERPAASVSLVQESSRCSSLPIGIHQGVPSMSHV